MGYEVDVESLEEAVEFCRLLQREGKADLFRGQTRDWPAITPSLFRGDEAAKSASNSVLSAFEEWSAAVPQMAPYREQDGWVTAIAQHYGIPTSFLDLTTDPEIAAIFACGSTENKDKAVIYCFQRSELEAIPGVSLVDLDVANLWRLEAQKGLFLHFANERSTSLVRQVAIRVHFPGRPASALDAHKIYPTRKSALELVIDQWIYRNTVETVMSPILSNAKIIAPIRHQTYPGVFRWREEPDITATWLGDESRWILPERRRLASANVGKVVGLTLDKFDTIQKAYADLQKQLTLGLQEAPIDHTVQLQVQIPGNQKYDELASIVLNRCWDGLCAHPFERASVVNCLAGTALALICRTLGGDWSEWEQQLWGETEAIDIAPVGGHLDSGVVSRSSFRSSISINCYDQLAAYWKRCVDEDPLLIMDYVVDPWNLFDFPGLCKMFVEEFIPSCLGWYWASCLEDNEGDLQDLWTVSFNPALIGFITRERYRFYSPMATERNADQVILIAEDMSDADLEEAFVSYLPGLLSGGEPCTVKFTDYTQDPREVWAIDRVAEQCRAIVGFGGISVLEVFPEFRDALGNSPEPEGPVNAFDGKGLGAFIIWAIANGHFDEVRGSPLNEIRHLVEKFRRDLGEANQNLEARMASQNARD